MKETYSKYRMIRMIDQTRKIRSETGCPYWAIQVCLILFEGDEEKTINQLEKMYAWYNIMGDNPDIVIKQHEKELKEEYAKYIKTKEKPSHPEQLL